MTRRSEKHSEDGEASLQRWSLERPAVTNGDPSGAGEGGGWVVGAPGIGSGERLVEQEDGKGWAPGGGGGEGAVATGAISFKDP